MSAKQSLKIVEEAPAVDPLRMEISIAVADRFARQERPHGRPRRPPYGEAMALGR